METRLSEQIIKRLITTDELSIKLEEARLAQRESKKLAREIITQEQLLESLRKQKNEAEISVDFLLEQLETAVLNLGDKND